ncbi:DNA polymerase IV [Roseibacillus ishigakijimensis]|uniref:DNA polymerase IV n=2 Tax=Roseibacillus ishigakijimensis TaxID=454146 RepID=A0A934RN21_9BACT|nr:DNA polymerase IV [Roseibacillus ishigakijimensis]
MDCFYAAIEERDQPALRGKPVGVGGRSQRGVLTTANYEARKYGCRSAMPVFMALEKCPHLILVPTRFEVYQEESQKIRAIFGRFSELIEPLSLDEAYLDITALNSPGPAVAREIRHQIREETGLTASAGIAPNKMLAKVASDWEKPDGQFAIAPEEVAAFMQELPVKKIPGVGQKMAQKLAALQVTTCGDLQRFERVELARRFGKWGSELYDLCRGVDDRAVRVTRERKSLSKETTFRENRQSLEELDAALSPLLESLQESLSEKSERRIKSLVVKLKFADFESTTAERGGSELERALFAELLQEAWQRGQGRAVRLLGVGVKFAAREAKRQLELEL